MALAFLVNQIPRQPIIVARLTENFTLDDRPSLYREIADLAAGFEGRYYRILDMTGTCIRLDDAPQSLLVTNEGVPGSASDPRVVKNFYIGQGEQAKAILALLAQAPTLSFSMIMTDSLEQALNAIYAEMENDDQDDRNKTANNS